MGYYKFNPKNHICSLAWTGLCLVSGSANPDTNFIESTLMSAVIGLPTVFVGINIREKQERKKRNKVVTYINTQKEVTVNQVISLLDITGFEANEMLTSLVQEDRIEVTNRESDMKVVYTPAS